MADSLTGLLVVDKPSGPTSFEVVRRVRHALGADRAGHTGTLDPLATGVLPICLGEATKIARFLSGSDKRYRAVARLGIETDSGDATGRVVQERAVPPISDAEIDAALARLRGPIRQRPPVLSAVHIAGVRAMTRARRGEKVEMPEREVVVHELVLVDRGPTEITLDVRCGAGTYVRSLVMDLGATLGCGAHLVSLRRTGVGAFRIEEALPLGEIESSPLVAVGRMHTPAAAVASLPTAVLSAEATRRVRQGQAIAEPLLVRRDPANEGESLRCLDEEGALIAVAALRGERLHPLRVLV